MATEMSNAKKAAVLLSSFPDEQCVQILKQFKEEDVIAIGREMMGLSEVSSEDRQSVLDEFKTAIQTGEKGGSDGASYAEGILSRVLGLHRSASVIDRIKEQDISDINLEELIESAGIITVVNCLKEEHPGVISTILATLPTKKATKVLDSFSPENQVDIIKSIAIGSNYPPELIGKMVRGFCRKIENARAPKEGSETKPLSPEGVRASADMLAILPKEKSQEILNTLKEQNAEMSITLQNSMFSFLDIVRLGNRDVQKILGKINQGDLKMALRKTSEDVKLKFMQNMSERAASMLEEDIEMMGPQKRSDVEDAQVNIVKIIRQLEEAGEVTIPKAVEKSAGGVGVAEEELV